MTRFLILTILLVISVFAFGQKHKLPPKDSYYVISKQDCSYPRQTGKLEVIRNDSMKMTTYRTDSTEMIMYADNFVGFLVGWDSINSAKEVYYQLDSVVTLLFKNGLLTSDLLGKAINVEEKAIDYNGDTLDWTRHIQIQTVKLLNIEKKELPKKYKDKKGTVLFEIWATFDIYESGWGSFPMFDLYLKSGIELNDSNLKEYLSNATIKCLRYTGIQI